MIIYIDGTPDEMVELSHGLLELLPMSMPIAPIDEAKKTAIEAWLTDRRPE